LAVGGEGDSSLRARDVERMIGIEDLIAFSVEALQGEVVADRGGIL
jgi:hypothetical protein